MAEDFIASSPMPLTRDSIQVARLQEQVSQLRLDVADIKAQALRDTQALRSEIQKTNQQNEQILEKLSEARGGWKLMVALGGIVTAVVSTAAWIYSHIRYTP